jgi:hypothetical protein
MCVFFVCVVCVLVSVLLHVEERASGRACTCVFFVCECVLRTHSLSARLLGLVSSSCASILLSVHCLQALVCK